MSVTPASVFEIVDEAPASKELTTFGYPDWASFGILDVLVTSEYFPLGKVRIVLEEAEYHLVDSSPMAFRHAGRDAGQKIVNEFKENSLPGH